MATEKIRLVMNRKDVAMVSNTNIPVSVGVRAEVVSELTRELGRMERLVIMLRYTEELTVAEIAGLLRETGPTAAPAGADELATGSPE